MKQNTHLIIMAGGIGSRFWPMSTPEKPKQFLDMTGCGRTMIQQTLDRFETLIMPENVWVVTSKNYASLVHEQLPEIPRTNILLEPCMRNTAPCIAYVSWKIKKQDPEANLIISPSDHLVTEIEEFRRVISHGLKFISGQARILTLGMQPTRPETGYGYIQSSGKAETAEIYQVAAFREKPDLQTAEAYLQSGNYYWNAGLFLWNVETIEQVFRRYVPEMAALFDTLMPVFYTEKEQESIDLLFPTAQSVSIDYAVMEKADNVYVFPASFGWSDLGTWGSLHTLVTSDSHHNSVIGKDVKMVESCNCMVHLPHDKKVVLQGLDGYIIAEHDGVLMICKMEEEQRIKEFSLALND